MMCQRGGFPRGRRESHPDGLRRLDGLDLVVEGEAAAVSDETVSRNVADAFESSMARISRRQIEPSPISVTASGLLVYRVAPSMAFGFGNGGAVQLDTVAFLLNSRASLYDQCRIGARNVPSAPRRLRPRSFLVCGPGRCS
jgi:hypothetical protein